MAGAAVAALPQSHGRGDRCSDHRCRVMPPPPPFPPPPMDAWLNYVVVGRWSEEVETKLYWALRIGKRRKIVGGLVSR